MRVFELHGLFALFTGESDRARDAFADQLQLCHEHEAIHQAPQGLIGLAAVAASQAQDERAARLFGAATAIGSIGDDNVVAQLQERFFSPARARHDERRWAGLESAGAQLSFEEAVAFALSPGNGTSD